ncbi:metal homeostatis BSD2 family protein [Guptibacillus algicola]|uniref:metal homeostatis BSD2 family protein n=1 Tax=Guptibacillus algicola TaxID=225844 RepID=UPI001CD22F4E|nr:metal homeostatis BSD2 family protein [Alkalihalobacillus algicola]MCA0985880.1 metal homeostatis BSD2 family protein [Alkalihalobacillus algicola]
MSFIAYFLMFFVVYLIVKGISNFIKEKKMDRISFIGGIILALIYSTILTIFKG